MARMNDSLPDPVSDSRRRRVLRAAVMFLLSLVVARAIPIERVDPDSGLEVRPALTDVSAFAERVLAAGPLTLQRVNGGVLTLNDGRVWWRARIVAIGTAVVTVSHDGGLAGVPIESVPVLELLQAQEATALAFKESKRWAEEEADREIERTKATLLAAQRALAAGPASAEPAGRQAPASEAEAAAAEPTKPGPGQRLTALKRKFPLRSKGRTDRGLEFDIPSTEVWLFYRRTFEAATLETLPETLAFMESRLTQNLDIWHWRSKTTESMPQSREHLVAARTHAWLDRTLRSFIAEARQLTRER